MLSEITKKVLNDVKTLDDLHFLQKYSVSKAKYLKRVARYGDPYLYSPLAKIGKFLKKIWRV